MASIARTLAERVAATRYEDLPPAAHDWSKIAVMDTLGVMLAGSREEAPRRLLDALQPHGDESGSLIVGSRERVAALEAALINGTAGHVLDFDNTAAHLGGHASVVMIPALLAAAERFGCSGRDVLLAHAVGYEVGGRLGRGVNYYHTEKGWHPTWTIGVFAVSAACARLLGLSVEQTQTALALSTSLASGTKANFGTMTKSLHAGECARAGLMSTLLARKGFTANLGAFEHRQGYLNVFNGPDHYDAARIVEGWGEPYDIVSPGASYKAYPCCYSTHSAVQAALNLVREHGRPFAEPELANVAIRTAACRLLHTDRPDPESELDAKFSIQYCVARALTDGRVSLDHFENGAQREASVRKLIERTRALAYTDKSFNSDDPFDADVTVTLKGGRTLSAYVEYPLGRTSSSAIPAEQMKAKFNDCATRVITPQAAAEAQRAIESFESVTSIRAFMALLEPREAHAPMRALS